MHNLAVLNLAVFFMGIPFKCIKEKGLYFTLLQGLFCIIAISSCQSKSISQPYREPIKKPKTCKCNDSKIFGELNFENGYSYFQHNTLSINDKNGW